MREYKHLTQKQRYQICILKQLGHKQIVIAKRFGLPRSTISRELRRNRGPDGRYDPDMAHEKAKKRKSQAKKHITITREMEQMIRNYLELDWSPEQIKGYCTKEGIPCVSHTRIYQLIEEDKQQGGQLYKHRRRTKRFIKKGERQSIGMIKDRVSISERPNIVDQRERIGDWEIDLMVCQGGYLVTVTERKTLFTLIGKVKKRDTQSVGMTVINLLWRYKNKVETITSDNGKEFSKHKSIASMLRLDYYFADPYSAWQRGTNENTNGLIRQYIKRSTPFSEVNLLSLEFVMSRLNNRPRKTRRYYSPNEMFVV